MAEKDKNGIGYSLLTGIINCISKSASDKAALCKCAFHSQVAKDVPSDIDPADVYLTRAWLLKHGWEPTNNYPLFQGSPDCIDCDLCVVVDRKDYMIAKFHYMGDDAWKPNAMPDSFELVGVNNSADLLEYDHTRLVMAAFVCHLTGFEQVDKAIGGKYEMTMIKKV